MRRKSGLFQIAAVVLLIIIGSGCSCSEMETFDGENAYELIGKQLEFGPRPPGSQALRNTGDWIIDELRSSGWEISEHIFEYRDVELRNIAGMWNPDTADQSSGGVILFGAHYDTRPLADLDPDHPEMPVPGANDGASGVAVLLELARVLERQNYPREVWMVFFDGEDSGNINGWEWIAGSSAYASQMEIEPDAVVIVDMVGDKDLDLYLEYNSDQTLAGEIWDTAEEQGIDNFIHEYRYSILDDHIPFLQQGWPAVDIIDFDYESWHTTQDTIDKVSAESLVAVGSTLENWLWSRVER